MDDDSPRARAARAKRSLRLNESADRSAPNTFAPRPSVKVSDLSFAVDDDTARSIEEERSKVRDILGLKE